MKKLTRRALRTLLKKTKFVTIYGSVCRVISTSYGKSDENTVSILYDNPHSDKTPAMIRQCNLVGAELIEALDGGQSIRTIPGLGYPCTVIRLHGLSDLRVT